jgi:hypoxanthine phosphoribosyltransferase
MVLSSYGAGAVESSGSIKVKKDTSINPAGRHVLILEDLSDSGKTLDWMKKHLSTKGCASVKIW